MKKVLHYVVSNLGLVLLLLLEAPVTIQAQDTQNLQQRVDARLVVATNGTINTRVNYTVEIPALRADNILMRGNTLQIKGAAVLSPVSCTGIAELNITPLAILKLLVSASLGSGWDIPIAYGLKLNQRIEGTHENVFSGAPLSACVWGIKFGGILQFDTGAVFPGQWNHIVMQTYHSLQYRSCSIAGPQEAWLFEADAGENLNGWVYTANLTIGYQIPPINTLAGFHGEVKRSLYNSLNGELWGEDLWYWVFGPAADIRFGKKLSATIMVQWRSLKNYTPETADYGFFQDRRILASNPQYVDFYRVNLTLEYRF